MPTSSNFYFGAEIDVENLLLVMICVWIIYNFTMKINGAVFFDFLHQIAASTHFHSAFFQFVGPRWSQNQILQAKIKYSDSLILSEIAKYGLPCNFQIGHFPHKSNQATVLAYLTFENNLMAIWTRDLNASSTFPFHLIPRGPKKTY